jgi:hypothetical protein
MKREVRDPVLKKSRWLLLKRGENLDDKRHSVSATSSAKCGSLLNLTHC